MELTLAQETGFTKIISEEEYTPDIFSEINVITDFVICVNDLSLITANIDGSFSLNVDRDYPLEPPKNNSKMIIFEYLAKVKFSIPRNFIIQWGEPAQLGYSVQIHAIYSKIIQKNAIIAEQVTKTANSTIFSQPKIISVIDLNLFNRFNKMGVFRKGESVASFNFIKRAHANLPSDVKDHEHKIFLIEHSELFNQFEDTFS